ncbi:MAG TPA: SRPBCC family protein [Acidimicrobiales bacterium]|nr:SRPBCC family protein [Acidimicrobiales bacterium]
MKGAHIITEHIDVGVSNERAYELWTDYGKWSDIFKNEEAGRARGQGRARSAGQKIRVTAKIGPSQRKWQAEVSDSDPGTQVSWRAVGGIQAMGRTSFHSLDDRLTHVMVEIEYRPSGLMEILGNFFRMQRRRVRRDLRLFKNFAELQGGQK